jgi:hypothetical protein
MFNREIRHSVLVLTIYFYMDAHAPLSMLLRVGTPNCRAWL